MKRSLPVADLLGAALGVLLLIGAAAAAADGETGVALELGSFGCLCLVVAAGSGWLSRRKLALTRELDDPARARAAYRRGIKVIAALLAFFLILGLALHLGVFEGTRARVVTVWTLIILLLLGVLGTTWGWYRARR